MNDEAALGKGLAAWAGGARTGRAAVIGERGIALHAKLHVVMAAVGSARALDVERDDGERDVAAALWSDASTTDDLDPFLTFAAFCSTVSADWDRCNDGSAVTGSERISLATTPTSTQIGLNICSPPAP